MTQVKPDPYSIVIAYDFSLQAELALTRAVKDATEKPASVLHVIGVIDEGGLGAVKRGKRADYTTAEELQSEIAAVAKARLRDTGRTPGKLYVHVRYGDPAEQVLALAIEAHADVIYIGTHGRDGLQRLLLGSVAETVVRRAGCPVVVVRPKTHYTADDRAFAPEPPCPRCVRTREETGGEAWWCEAHAKARVRPHRYSYNSDIVEIRRGDNVLW